MPLVYKKEMTALCRACSNNGRNASYSEVTDSQGRMHKKIGETKKKNGLEKISKDTRSVGIKTVKLAALV